MIEPIDSETVVEPLAPEAEIEAADDDVAIDPEVGDEDLGIDYDRIIGGVTQRIAEAALEMQARQDEGHSQSANHAPVDPYEQVADLMWQNPAEALRVHGELVRRQTLQEVMPYVQPVAAQQAIGQVTHGLDEGGQQFVHQFLRETGIDPAFLNHPTIADLVRSKAELHQLKRGGRSPIPSTESSGGSGSPHMDADTRRELSGIERMYKSLGIKFDPSRILGRMK